MDLAVLVADGAYITNLLGLAVQAAQDVVPFVTLLEQVLVQKQALTDDQRAQMGANETALRALLNAPSIPADQS